MGMDPVDKDETYEVNIVIEGPLTIDDFKKFRTALQDFLDKFPSKPASGGNPAIPGIPWAHGQRPNGKNVLQVREGRGGQRKNA